MTERRGQPITLNTLRDVDPTGIATGDVPVWDGTTKKYKPGAVAREIVFSYPGALLVSTSPPWTPAQTVTLAEVRCLLGTAGTTSTVVTVYKNGTSVGTVTLTSGQTNVTAAFSTSLTANTDILTVGVTTVGTGAANLTATARY